MKWCREMNCWTEDFNINPDYCDYVCDGCENVVFEEKEDDCDET